MRKTQLWVSLLFFYTLFLAGCGGTDTGEITSPLPQDELTYAELPEFVVEFSDGLPNVFTAELNDNDVTAHFVLEPAAGEQKARAYAAGADLSSFVVSGENVFDVVDPSSIGNVTFLYDNKGPEVRILSYTENGANADITGYLYDETGPASLTLNGVNVPLTDGAFTTSTALAELYSFSATDTFNITKDATFRTGGAAQNSFAAMQLNPAGLPVALGLVEQFIYNHDYAAFLAEGDNGRIMHESVLGQSIALNINDITIPNTPTPKNVDFNLTLLDGNKIGLAGTIRTIDLDLQGTVELCLPKVPLLPQVCADVSLSGSGTGQDVYVEADAQVVIDGDGVLTATNINIINANIGSIDNLVLNGTAGSAFTLLLGEVTTAAVNILLTSNTIQTVALAVVEDAIIDLIPPLVESIYADLDKTITLPINLGLGTPDAELAVTIAPSAVNITSTEALIEVNGVIEPDVIRSPSLGYYYTGAEPFPVLPALTPDGSTYHLGAMLGEDTFNMALEAAFRAGLFNISATTTELAQFDIATIVLLQDVLYGGDLLGSPLLDADDEVRVILSLPSTPLAEFRSNSHPVHIALNDATVTIEFRGDPASEWQSLLNATIDLSVPFGVDFDSDTRTLVLNGDSDNFNVDYHNTNPNPLFRLGEEFGEAILEMALPFVFPLITEIAKSIELPTYAGYSMDLQEIWVVPGTKVLAIGANLEP